MPPCWDFSFCPSIKIVRQLEDNTHGRPDVFDCLGLSSCCPHRQFASAAGCAALPKEAAAHSKHPVIAGWRHQIEHVSDNVACWDVFCRAASTTGHSSPLNGRLLKWNT